MLGDGANDVVCTNSTIGGLLTVTAGDGDDSLDTTGTTAGGTQIELDGGLDTMVAP